MRREMGAWAGRPWDGVRSVSWRSFLSFGIGMGGLMCVCVCVLGAGKR